MVMDELHLLKQKIESETDGSKFDRLKNRLIKKYGESHRKEVLDILTSYAFHGRINHWRNFILTDIIRLQYEGETLYSSFWEKAILHPDLAYWSVDGLLKSNGKDSYSSLVLLLDNVSYPLEVKAKIIKELAQHSKQLFDRNLPSDPGYWKENDLWLDEIRIWAESSFPEGKGYQEPIRYPALDNPITKFEKLMARWDIKLSKMRRTQTVDLSNP